MSTRSPLLALFLAASAALSCSSSSTKTDGGQPQQTAACTPACATGLTCLAGACVPTSCATSADCPATFICQSGFCGSGACSPACPLGQVCSGGSCLNENPCGAHESVCGDGSSAYCANLQQDGNNCGTCGVICPIGEACSRGVCAPSCLGNETLCTNLCANLTTDNANCGACGKVCAAGQVCANGACATTCSGVNSTECGTGQARYCADIDNSPFDCGGCGTTCGPTDYCTQGSCQSRCGGLASQLCDGICVDLQTDLENCGACNHACGSGLVCYGGACVATCGFPDITCSEGTTGSYCANLLEDSNHCGGCTQVCPPAQVCSAGVCAASCSGSAGALCNGTCVHLASDNQNCGSCGASCPEGEVCNGDSLCATTCALGYSLCGTGVTAYCAALPSDPANCGTCGQACAGDQVCTAGVCLTLDAGTVPDGGDAGSGTCGSSNCGPGTSCVGETCLSQSCANVACAGDEVCLDGGCLQAKCVGVTCGTGEGCGNGGCYPTVCNGQACTEGLCWNSACVPPDCAGLSCGTDQVCAAGQCQTSCAAGCSPPAVCLGGACQAGCTIAGTAYAAGALEPSDFCESCQPAIDPGGWTALTSGNSCPGGICASGACVPGCVIDGVGYASGATDPQNACILCNPALSATSWSAGVDDAPCGASSFCRGGGCVPGCEIGGDGGFLAPGSLNPANPCQSCQPAESGISYSPLPDATACTDGNGGTYCIGGSCAAACLVAGTDAGPQLAGAPDPQNPCESCQPASNASQYSALNGPVPVPGACAPGDVCQGGACTYGCFISGSYVAGGAVGPTLDFDAGVESSCCAPLDNPGAWTPEWASRGYGAGSGVVGVTYAEVNGSQGLGAVFANSAAQTVDVLYNLGDGNLSQGASYNLGEGANLGGLADLTGDGILDLVAAGNGACTGDVGLAQGNDAGTFGAFAISNDGICQNLIGVAPRFFTSAPRGAVIALDYYTTNLWVLQGTDAGLTRVWGADENFRWLSPLSGQQALVADLNGDGLDDVALSSAYGNPLVAVMLNDAQGHLGTESDYFVGDTPQGIAAGNMFGRHYDGGAPILDLVTFVVGLQQVVVLGNDGNGNFTPVGSSPALSDAGSVTVASVAAGDFNGDGIGDAAVLYASGSPLLVQIFLGDGTGNLVPGPTFPTSLTSASGMSMLGGPYGLGGASGFFSIIDSSAVSLFQDACH